MALLDTEADDIIAFSKAVWNLVEDLLNERERYVVFAIHPSLNLVQAVGPYDTKAKALTDYQKHINAYDSQSKARLALLRNPDTITE